MTEPTTDTRVDIRSESSLLQQQWHGWGSPIGLGVGLLCTGGFFWLLALGLSILSSI
jgi:hypothetical protein